MKNPYIPNETKKEEAKRFLETLLAVSETKEFFLAETGLSEGKLNKWLSGRSEVPEEAWCILRLTQDRRHKIPDSEGKEFIFATSKRMQELVMKEQYFDWLDKKLCEAKETINNPVKRRQLGYFLC